jgi:hypothetical protein
MRLENGQSELKNLPKIAGNCETDIHSSNCVQFSFVSLRKPTENARRTRTTDS